MNNLKIMAINSGSSSLKFKLYEMPAEKVCVSGIIERIGSPEAQFSINNKTKTLAIKNHEEAIRCLLTELLKQNFIDELNEIVGVGHRVAHGGEFFDRSTIVNKKEFARIEQLGELAPLHNPVNAMGIKVFSEVLPQSIQVAVFDTAFHQTIPSYNYLYPLPYSLYQKYKIRKYGFHGTSHQYVAKRAAEFLKLDFQEANFITCHLGNGASICCIKDGKSFDTSMGFTPTDGVMMGTRSGGIDPMIFPFLEKNLLLDVNKIEHIINKESGLLGISGISNDFRDVQNSARNGNELSKIAIKMFVRKISEYILSYTSELKRIDGIVFTAGIGEHSAYVRQQICEQLTCLNVKLNKQKNNDNDKLISSKNSKVKVLVIPTDEELVIAKDTYKLVHNLVNV
ncbi:MAG: acetate kinase [Liquorilactobacillus ghanensis]|uniref:acetate/propionate family kinase n=1 Tax=Liquorilactobacillus ghanensis TaxID=399370 RepID=UPI0039EA941D